MARILDRLTPQNQAGIAFRKLWQKTVEKIEELFASQQGQLDDLTQAQADIVAAQADIAALVSDLADAVADIQTAQAAADAAQADAIAAAREAARIVSYPNPGSILTAADAGSDASITIANHTRVYPVQGSIDVPDVSITGGSITALAFSTRYFIYYDDTTLANTTPTFVATTDSATAQVGAAAGRHFLGYVTTPADGGGSTGGTGGGPPGGGGGGGGGGVYIP